MSRPREPSDSRVNGPQLTERAAKLDAANGSRPQLHVALFHVFEIALTRSPCTNRKMSRVCESLVLITFCLISLEHFTRSQSRNSQSSMNFENGALQTECRVPGEGRFPPLLSSFASKPICLCNRICKVRSFWRAVLLASASAAPPRSCPLPGLPVAQGTPRHHPVLSELKGSCPPGMGLAQLNSAM